MSDLTSSDEAIVEWDELPPASKEILYIIHDRNPTFPSENPMKVSEVAEVLGETPQTTRYRMQGMLEEGLIQVDDDEIDDYGNRTKYYGPSKRGRAAFEREQLMEELDVDLTEDPSRAQIKKLLTEVAGLRAELVASADIQQQPPINPSVEKVEEKIEELSTGMQKLETVAVENRERIEELER
jgi:predicted ArsR family transcriptional regulator